eukprot:scaffold48541_cov63-Cyclotella_meneghiniana.AAC.3
MPIVNFAAWINATPITNVPRRVSTATRIVLRAKRVLRILPALRPHRHLCMNLVTAGLVRMIRWIRAGCLVEMIAIAVTDSCVMVAIRNVMCRIIRGVITSFAVLCPSGYNAECDAGESCFASTPCDSNAIAADSTVRYGLPVSAMNLAMQYVPSSGSGCLVTLIIAKGSSFDV